MAPAAESRCAPGGGGAGNDAGMTAVARVPRESGARGHTALPDQILAVPGGVPGLDLARLKRDMERPEFAKVLEQDIADVKALKLTQTPTFCINGKLLEPFGVESLRAQVRAAVALQYR